MNGDKNMTKLFIVNVKSWKDCPFNKEGMGNISCSNWDTAKNFKHQCSCDFSNQNKGHIKI